MLDHVILKVPREQKLLIWQQIPVHLNSKLAADNTNYEEASNVTAASTKTLSIALFCDNVFIKNSKEIA